MSDIRGTRIPSAFYSKSIQSGDSMDFVFRPDRFESFKIIYVRTHFVGGSIANLIITLDSSIGDEHNTQLYLASDRGNGADMNLVFTNDELADPSPWAFQRKDGLRFEWLNPSDVGSWGIEIGYELLK